MTQKEYDEEVRRWRERFGYEMPDDVKEEMGPLEDAPYTPVNAIFDSVKWVGIIVFIPVWLPLVILKFVNDICCSPGFKSHSKREDNWKRNI